MGAASVVFFVISIILMALALAAAKKKASLCIWFTGLSGSGKTTLADHLYAKLESKGYKCQRLDGDILRNTLNSDLGFSIKDREENIRRVSWISAILAKHMIVISSFISPTEKSRLEAREKVEGMGGTFVEVYIDVPLSVCKERDPKGLYEKVEAGKIDNFTGIDSPYEEPEDPDLTIDTDKHDIQYCVDRIVGYIECVT